MATRHSLKILLAVAEARKTALQNGALYFYSGSQPASPNSAPSGTLLGIATLAGGAFTHGIATNGLTFAAPVIDGENVKLSKPAGQDWKINFSAAGTIGWCRYKANPVDNDLADPTGLLARLDLSVSLESGTGDIKVSKLTYAAGETGQMTTFNLTESNALQPALPL